MRGLRNSCAMSATSRRRSDSAPSRAFAMWLNATPRSPSSLPALASTRCDRSPLATFAAATLNWCTGASARRVVKATMPIPAAAAASPDQSKDRLNDAASSESCGSAARTTSGPGGRAATMSPSVPIRDGANWRKRSPSDLSLCQRPSSNMNVERSPGGATIPSPGSMKNVPNCFPPTTTGRRKNNDDWRAPSSDTG